MKKILILLLNGSEVLEIAPFIDIFGWNNILKKFPIEVITGGFHPYIDCCWNIKVVPELILNEETSLEEFSALVVPGGFGGKGYFEEGKNPLVKKIITHFYQKKKIVVGVCTGSLLVLKIISEIHPNPQEILGTTYLRESKRYFNQLKKLNITPVEETIVQWENIYSSSGPGTSLPLAFHLLSILSNQENSQRVKKEMEFEF